MYNSEAAITALKNLLSANIGAQLAAIAAAAGDGIALPAPDIYGYPKKADASGHAPDLRVYAKGCKSTLKMGDYQPGAKDYNHDVLVQIMLNDKDENTSSLMIMRYAQAAARVIYNDAISGAPTLGMKTEITDVIYGKPEHTDQGWEQEAHVEATITRREG